jgi:Phage Tail Collar Domain
MKRLIYSITLLVLILCSAPRPAAAQAASPYLGEIQLFAFSFCPKGWVPLNGQLLIYQSK